MPESNHNIMVYQEAVREIKNATGCVKNGQTTYARMNDWPGKTRRERLNNFVSRLGTGYNQRGSHNYPIAALGVDWRTFTPIGRR